MLKKYIVLFVCYLCPCLSRSQVTENFSDGDFTTNPVWLGNTADWTINAPLQLQSRSSSINSTFYLSTGSALATQAQWEIYTSFTFNPSSANYTDIFLMASQHDITDPNTTGYFVRVGNTDDDISLYRKDAGGLITRLIDGVNGIVNTSNNILKIKVIRDATSQFSLFRDITGTGNNYVAEGIAHDARYMTSSYFGIMVRQSTAAFFERHFFDDIEVKAYVPDLSPPAIQSVIVQSSSSLDVLFTEPVEAGSSQVSANYVVNNSIGTPVQALRDAANGGLVHLTFPGDFPNGSPCTLTVNGIKDLAGNILNNGMATFSFYRPQRYDVIIDEIMADPTPVVALPNAEFIELKNRMGRELNLSGCKISSLTSVSSPFPAYILPPDSFLIVTSTSNAALFTATKRVIGLAGFPSLDNNGTTLSLLSKESTVLHAITYDISWYENAVKSEGGWTLEMVDTGNPCSGRSNWKASTDLRGGTPGARNAVNGTNNDVSPPTLTRAYAQDSVTLVLQFDETLDSSKAAIVAHYTISDGIGEPLAALPLGPLFNKVQLTPATALSKNKVYMVIAQGVSDCAGNTASLLNTVKVALPVPADSFDVIINEVLFNPKPDGTDYIEVYNRSSKIVDLKNLYIANRAATSDMVVNVKAITTETTLIFPGEYYVLSENAQLVKHQYVALNPGNFADVASLPPYADDKGTVVLLNAEGKIVDELRYDEKWHFSLVDNSEGISLERTDYNKPTQLKDNWFSAASTSGFGTPSYQNSQFRADLQLQGAITVTPKSFSPDGDGFDDFTLINYKMSETGYVANITVFNAEGRSVKVLQRNALLASSGSFRWDGLDDKMSRVPVGTYIIYTEVFNLNGKKKQFKNTVVIAARL